MLGTVTEYQPSGLKPGRDNASPAAATLAEDWIVQPLLRAIGAAAAGVATTIRLAAAAPAIQEWEVRSYPERAGHAETPAGGGVPWSIALDALIVRRMLEVVSPCVKNFLK